MVKNALTLCGFHYAGLVQKNAPQAIRDLARDVLPRAFHELSSLREGPATPRPRIAGGHFLPGPHANRKRLQSVDLERIINQKDLTAEDFADTSLELMFPEDDFGPSIPRDIKTAISTMWVHRHRLPEYRRERIDIFTRLITELQPLDTYMREYQSPLAYEATRGASLPLIGLLLDVMQFPYRAFLRDYAFRGMPCMGCVPDTGLWARRSNADIDHDKSLRISVDDLAAGRSHDGLNNLQYVDKWSRKLLARYEEATLEDRVAAQEGWKKTKAEIADRTSFLYTADELDDLFGKGKWRACVSFPILQNGKYRIIDDHKHGGGNLTVVLAERLALAPPDFPAAVAVEVAQLAHADGALAEAQCALAVDDESHAYRNVPVSHPQYTVVMQVDTDADAIRFILRRGHSFGQK